MIRFVTSPGAAQPVGTSDSPQFAGLGIGAAGISGALALGSSSTRLTELSASVVNFGDGTTSYFLFGKTGSTGYTQLPSGGMYTISSGVIGAASDWSLSRAAAGVVQSGDGGANANGKFNAARYQAGGTDGVAGPTTLTTITSITVKGGIVTAIAGS